MCQDLESCWTGSEHNVLHIKVVSKDTVSKDTVALDTAFYNVHCQNLESCGAGSEHNGLQR